MGFEEIFVFVVVGWVASYRQRSLATPSSQEPNHHSQTLVLWILAVVLPSLAIAWTTLHQTALPLIFVTTCFLLCIWIYRTWYPSSNSDISNSDIEASLSLYAHEEKQLKDCFPPAIYLLKGLEYRDQEIYCRGKLRSPNPKYAYDIIAKNLQQIFGDRFTCYLEESPLENVGTSFGSNQDMQETATNYCFYLRPQAITRKQNFLQSWLLSSLSILLTIFALFVVGANIARIEDLSLIDLQLGIPYGLGVMGIFMGRAISHYWIAKQYKLTYIPPLFLPCLGSFGMLGSLNSFLHQGFNETKNLANQRRILFDLAVVPTVTGLVISAFLIFLGNLSPVPSDPLIANPAIAPSFLVTELTTKLMTKLATFEFKDSILATLLQAVFSIGRSGVTAINGSEAIPSLSPLTLAGWAGLALSALQLMPFDLLDGGNLAIAMFGHRQAVVISRITRLVLIAIALFAQPWLRIYSLLLFILPAPRALLLNENFALDRRRDLIGMILMAIALLIILPLPKSLLSS
ncbi:MULTISPECIES: peptidase M50 [Pseudanabaena]|uniref:Peptidase M50 n=2 Tax=Pseudanabaena TaxID=1152 RepID=L8N2V3_9CYAN|nr:MULTISPECIES: peptidase M50 [Pseudanabaena]ELS32588.1 peptidase M50 [Pseudanabaena biceps PCC 7429]MDG3495182.1 hypothetical protein [Pseudanabaena catenata USMAC16]